MVDCRKCQYYTPTAFLDALTRVNALVWRDRERPGEPLYGYCERYKRGITYLRGSCRGYKPKQRPVSHTLDEYLPVARATPNDTASKVDRIIDELLRELRRHKRGDGG